MKSNKAIYPLGGKGYTGIGHTAFVTDDMDKALDFYCNKLGFQRIYDMPDEAGNPWLIYLRVKDGTFLELFYDGTKQLHLSDSSAGFMHMCLECDDVYKTVEELRSRGVEIDVEPSQGKDKNYQAWIHDPNGNKIELMTIDPDSPQATA
ncbi:MAG: VOC family protein [Gorillibacterium sp.]|nr:VOC family protein [Gorillibacterium sp.]